MVTKYILYDETTEQFITLIKQNIETTSNIFKAKQFDDKYYAQNYIDAYNLNPDFEIRQVVGGHVLPKMKYLH